MRTQGKHTTPEPPPARRCAPYLPRVARSRQIRTEPEMETLQAHIRTAFAKGRRQHGRSPAPAQRRRMARGAVDGRIVVCPCVNRSCLPACVSRAGLAPTTCVPSRVQHKNEGKEGEQATCMHACMHLRNALLRRSACVSRMIPPRIQPHLFRAVLPTPSICMHKRRCSPCRPSPRLRPEATWISISRRSRSRLAPRGAPVVLPARMLCIVVPWRRTTRRAAARGGGSESWRRHARCGAVCLAFSPTLTRSLPHSANTHTHTHTHTHTQVARAVAEIVLKPARHLPASIAATSVASVTQAPSMSAPAVAAHPDARETWSKHVDPESGRGQSRMPLREREIVCV